MTTDAAAHAIASAAAAVAAEAADSAASTGLCADAFRGVRDLFDSLLAADPAYGAQLALYHRGRKVIDLVGGPGIAADTVTGVFSCSKGVGALAFSLLVQDGTIGLDERVATYWPEFSRHGKGELLVCELLSHQGGLVGVHGGFRPEEYNDAAAAAARLADAVPFWRPGNAFGYHALTMGVFMEELCRRVSGASLQELYEARIRAPFGIEMYLGLPPEQDHRYRPVLFDPQPEDVFTDPHGLDGIAGNVIAGSLLELPNIRSIRAAGSASAAGTGSAEGLARLYAGATTGLDGGAPFLAPGTIAAMSQEQVWGLDRISSQTNAFAVVFMKPHARKDFGSHLAFGHDGANGSLGFADPGYGTGFGYVPARVEEGGTTGRSMRLSAAVRRAILDMG
jgi:CubicO group peptidase (beta-lactamase class C family)